MTTNDPAAEDVKYFTEEYAVMSDPDLIGTEPEAMPSRYLEPTGYMRVLHTKADVVLASIEARQDYVNRLKERGLEPTYKMLHQWWKYAGSSRGKAT